MKSKIGIGIDLGGSSIKYALGRLDGEILKRGSRPSRSKEEAPVILDEIAKAIHDLNDYASFSQILLSYRKGKCNLVSVYISLM